jgi:hypothetical protein
MSVPRMQLIGLLIGIVAVIAIIGWDVVAKLHNDEATYSMMLYRADSKWKSIAYMLIFWLGTGVGHWFFPQRIHDSEWILRPDLDREQVIRIVNFLRGRCMLPPVRDEIIP